MPATRREVKMAKTRVCRSCGDEFRVPKGKLDATSAFGLCPRCYKAWLKREEEKAKGR